MKDCLSHEDPFRSLRRQTARQRDAPPRDQDHARDGLGRIEEWEALEKAEEAGFEVLLTVDQNIRYQQNLKGRSIAVVVMIAGGITVDDLRLLIPAVEQTLLSVQPGQLYEVTLPIIP
ncbi:MAG: hypothetical protein ACREBD_02470 [Blastocatellia bacterium]